jgi:hypothetical protein
MKLTAFDIREGPKSANRFLERFTIDIRQTCYEFSWV